jgi:4-hydroxybenzoate polyprenyltransferase
MSTEAGPPLVVDLDGAVVRGDTLWESCILVARKDAVTFAKCCLAIRQGRAGFKQSIANHAALNPELVVLNQDVIDFVRAESATRTVILATSADQRIAEGFSGVLGSVDHVLGSIPGRNPKGRARLTAIQGLLQSLDEGPEFDYIGASKSDAPIWKKAHDAHVIARSRKAAEGIAGRSVDRVFDSGAMGMRDWLKGLRLHQWAKNLLVFVAPVLSHRILEPAILWPALVSFLALGLCASATYLINDTLDVHSDRTHPSKRKRPIASGAISIPAALTASLLLIAVGMAMSVWLLALPASLGLVAYIVLTLAYSLALKGKLLVDVLVLSMLFGTRVLIGSEATSIPVSAWLIAFCVFLFTSLALAKRYVEVAGYETLVANERIRGRGYFKGDREVIGILGVGTSLIATLILALYVTSVEVSSAYSNPTWLWGICLVMFYWVSRVWFLAYRAQLVDDPIVFAISDKISIGSGLICGMFLLLAIL